MIQRSKKMLRLSVLMLLTMANVMCSDAQPRVLVFSKTTGFRHDNIEKGAETIKQLGATHGFTVDHTEDASLFTDENLKQYRAVVFLSTTGTILDDQQKAAFMRYIQAGNGFVGIHAASDTEYEWPWYGKLVGGYFLSHPQVQHADIHVVDKSHPATKHLPDVWNRKDEWYDFKDLNDEVTLLMRLDETSYQGGKMGDYHPMSWYHEYDGGRAFYTALGHTKESFDEPAFQQHIVGAIHYAMGN
ncbi:hypothetical protein SAMN05660226_03130 [Parapedobacter luteus]|uniref:ThuA-like domain-containing protein n=2 Tax=Parapedobacter luteus TaxID=623280 RepID=A0A1T5E3V6_9SPHI|nr:hypothetical protein SAMN05660226_03130 [Parapedobacter luteus]